MFVNLSYIKGALNVLGCTWYVSSKELTLEANIALVGIFLALTSTKPMGL